MIHHTLAKIFYKWNIHINLETNQLLSSNNDLGVMAKDFFQIT